MHFPLINVLVYSNRLKLNLKCDSVYKMIKPHNTEEEEKTKTIPLLNDSEQSHPKNRH